MRMGVLFLSLCLAGCMLAGPDDSPTPDDELTLGTYEGDEAAGESLSDSESNSDSLSSSDDDPDDVPDPECSQSCGVNLIDCLISSNRDQALETACHERYTTCLTGCD